MKIELEDLVADLNHLVEDYTSRKKAGNITNYVFMENLALLKHEMYGINKFIGVLHEISIDEYSSIDELLQDVIKKLRKMIIKIDFEECLFPMIERRLIKVAKFIE